MATASLAYRVHPSLREEWRVDFRRVLAWREARDGKDPAKLLLWRAMYVNLLATKHLITEEWYDAAIASFLEALERGAKSALSSTLGEYLLEAGGRQKKKPTKKEAAEKEKQRKEAAEEKERKQKESRQRKLRDNLREHLVRGILHARWATPEDAQMWLDAEKELADDAYAEPANVNGAARFVVGKDKLVEEFEAIVHPTYEGFSVTRANPKNKREIGRTWTVKFESTKRNGKVYTYTEIGPPFAPREGVSNDAYSSTEMYGIWADVGEGASTTPLHLSNWNRFKDHPLFGDCVVLSTWFMRTDFRALGTEKGFSTDGIGRITMFQPVLEYAEAGAKNVVLEVMQGSSSIGVYASMGFKKICEMMDHTGGREDAYDIMYLPLDEATLRLHCKSRILASGGPPRALVKRLHIQDFPAVEE
jgi:hypothetical protein